MVTLFEKQLKSTRVNLSFFLIGPGPESYFLLRMHQPFSQSVPILENNSAPTFPRAERVQFYEVLQAPLALLAPMLRIFKICSPKKIGEKIGVFYLKN
jgi:hypothetical protein